MLLAVLTILVACLPLLASQEYIAPWKSVTFVCKPNDPFPETTVSIETDGNTIQAIRVTNKQFDLKVPREAFADLVQPLIQTARLHSEPGYDKTPWLYVTLTLENPKPGEVWDSPTFYLKIKDGKVVGRSLKRIKDGQVTFEDLPYKAE